MPNCPTCGPCQSETDDTLGHVVCTSCGAVLEENAIVSQIEFSEGSGVQGLSISNNDARQRSSGKFSTQERVLDNGSQIISQIAVGLQFSQRHITAAQRFYALAVSHSFNKGRRTQVLCAACLYIACRIEKTSHLLIDFADSLQVNVYVLGATFLRLVQVLHIGLPLVDPALYIAKYASKLDFKDKTQKVITDALRLVQRMNRDWIQTGRRPAGICAAALFIASRMSGFQRSHQEIIFTVKVCEQTLKLRLEEIKNTPSGQLSVQDFNTLWLEESADPPAFKKGTVSRKRRVEGAAVDGEVDPFADDEIDDPFADKDVDDDPFAAPPVPVIVRPAPVPQREQKRAEVPIATPIINDDPFADEEEDDPFADENDTQTNPADEAKDPFADSEDDDPFSTTQSTLVGKPLPSTESTLEPNDDLNLEVRDYLKDPVIASFVDEYRISIEEQDDLLDLDDDPEVCNAVLEEREIAFKKSIWMDENAEWLELQDVVKEPRKKKSKKTKQEEDVEGEKPSKIVLSKKINYEVLDAMFDD